MLSIYLWIIPLLLCYLALRIGIANDFRKNKGDNAFYDKESFYIGAVLLIASLIPVINIILLLLIIYYYTTEVLTKDEKLMTKTLARIFLIKVYK